MEHVTIVIPLYNKQAYIRRTLDSVAAQTYAHFEVLVVDDGSTDNGAIIARHFPDERVRVIKSTGSGTSAARNTGIRAATHDLIAFLDADDEWHPRFLETVLQLHDASPQAGMYGTEYETEYAGIRRKARIKGLPKKSWQGLIARYFRSVLFDIPVISSAVMVPRRVFNNIGGFATGAQLGEDQDMWCRIALEYPVAYTTEVRAVYHLDTHNSVCQDISIIDTYPVMETVKKALEHRPLDKELRLYQKKLYLDYAIRLIRAKHFDKARVSLKAAGWYMVSMRLRAEYYFLVARIKQFTHSGKHS